MYGRFTRALILCAISAGAVAACSSKGEHAAAAAPAPAASADEQIKAAENSWRIALVSGDTVTLGKLTAVEFTMPKAGHPALTTSRKDLMTEIGGGMVQSDTSAVNNLAVKANG